MSKRLVRKVFKRAIDKSPGDRKKRTLVLSTENYENFEKICRNNDLWPSEIIDEFIGLCIEEKKLLSEIRR